MFVDTCFGLLPIAVIKTMTQSNLRKKGAISTYSYNPSKGEVRARI